VNVSVLVVEDFKPFRQVICKILGSEPHIDRIFEVGDGIQAVKTAAELQPHLILLDIQLPLLDGIEASRRIRDISPGSKILFLSQEQSTEVVSEALSTGACGYVVKADAGAELTVAVNAVLRGEKFVSERVKNVSLLTTPQAEGAS